MTKTFKTSLKKSLNLIKKFQKAKFSPLAIASPKTHKFKKKSLGQKFLNIKRIILNYSHSNLFLKKISRSDPIINVYAHQEEAASNVAVT